MPPELRFSASSAETRPPATRTSNATVGRIGLEIRRDSAERHQYQSQRPQWSILSVNLVAHLDRPPHAREAPTQVPEPAIMDALARVAKARRRPRDVAIFLIFRYTGCDGNPSRRSGFAIWIPSGDSATS